MTKKFWDSTTATFNRTNYRPKCILDLWILGSTQKVGVFLAGKSKSAIYSIQPFHAIDLFLYPEKTSEN